MAARVVLLGDAATIAGSLQRDPAGTLIVDKLTIVGAAASELVATWTLAMSRGAGIGSLAGTVVPYPTLAEIGKQAAATYLMTGLTRPWVRRIISLLRHFG